MMDQLHSGYAKPLIALILVLTPLALYGPMLTVGPFEAHAVIAMNFGANRSFADLLTQPEAASGLRILPFATFLVEYALFGTNTSGYYVTNLLFLAAFGAAVFLFAQRILDDPPAAVLVAVLAMALPQMSQNVVWVSGRQSIMAAFFGFAALALAARQDRPLSPGRWISIGLCLVLACLSKEFGLIFLALVPLYFLLFRQSRALAAGAVSSAVFLAYLAAWATVVGPDLSVPRWKDKPGAMSCERMGFFVDTRQICTTTDLADPESVSQIAYNIGAGVVSPLLPVFFDGDGSLNEKIFGAQAKSKRVVRYGLLGAVAVILLLLSARANFRVWLFLMGCIAANGLVCFALYRARNVIPGFVAAILIYVTGFKFLLERVVFDQALTRLQRLAPLERLAGTIRAQPMVPRLGLYLALTVTAVVAASQITGYVEKKRSAILHPLSHCPLIERYETKYNLEILEQLLSEHGRSRAACQST